MNVLVEIDKYLFRAASPQNATQAGRNFTKREPQNKNKEKRKKEILSAPVRMVLFYDALPCKVKQGSKRHQSFICCRYKFPTFSQRREIAKFGRAEVANFVSKFST